MKKYIATYTFRNKVTETLEIECLEGQAHEVAMFHKNTRGLKGKIQIELKK